MGNLDIYEKVRAVPDNAKKTIKAGRLKGMTDINPLFRIKAMTEAFGPCGVGWKYKITDKHLEEYKNGEVKAFVDIDLFYKWDGEWSEAIPGTGGASFVANEGKGPYVSDECYKMALTDAISVACKALGVGADVYWQADRTKYSDMGEKPEADKPPTVIICERCSKKIKPIRVGEKVYSVDEIAKNSKSTYGHTFCWDCMKAIKREAKGAEGFES